MFDIKKVDNKFAAALQKKIDLKTKPLGALGKLEEIAFKVGCIQNTLTPSIDKPAIVVFAGDHGIVDEGVSPFPQEVTYQMVMNFLNGGAAINVFADQNDISMYVVDAGVNYDFPVNPQLIDLKIAKGTRNFAKEPAMSIKQCQEAIDKGAELIAEINSVGTNVIGFGEMGIGNTSSAAALFSVYSGLGAEVTSGKGTGLDQSGVNRKAEVINKAIEFHGDREGALDIFATFGGFEIAMATGAMLKAAELGMLILVDGFIITSALIAARAINENVMDYCLFSHLSDEQGHKRMLEYLDGEAILQMDLRLGEGTGAALVLPMVKSAVNFLNQMASFEDAGVSNKDQDNHEINNELIK